jgi:hypothetical protein
MVRFWMAQFQKRIICVKQVWAKNRQYLEMLCYDCWRAKLNHAINERTRQTFGHPEARGEFLKLILAPTEKLAPTGKVGA